MLINTRHTHADQSHRDQPGRSSRRRDPRRLRVVLAIPTAVAAAALIGAPFAAATPAPTGSAPAAKVQGIIMSDGNICDPIRHIGC